MDALGGTCLNRGCIPAKAFLETAAVHRHVAHAADFGIEAGSRRRVDFAGTQQRKQKIVAGLVGGIAAMCKGRKVEVFNGTGIARRRTTPSRSRQRRVDRRTITGDAVILAAGSVPRLIPGFERGGPIMTSDEVLDLDHVPARVVVIGGGAIGCEFASTFADLGAEVTILEACRRSCPASTRTSPTSSCAVVQEEEDRHPHGRDGQRATRRTAAVARPCTSATASRARGRRRRRLGRPPAVRRQPRPRRHRGQGRRAGLRRGRRVLPHRRGRASTPSAT